MENKAFEDVDLEAQDEVKKEKQTEGGVDNEGYQNVAVGVDEAGTGLAEEAARSNQRDAQMEPERDGPYAGMGKEVLLKYSQTAKWRGARWFCAFILVAGWCTMLAMAIYIIMTTPKCLPWWQLSTIYQIYPRSFYDSDGDGIGDLQGIISKSDYISSLGVGAVLLNSIFKDGDKDYGYDVVDFMDVDKDLGTLEDFEDLLTAFHDLNIKVLLDFIPNHSSDQHPWFIGSRDPEHEDESLYDYYMWGKDGGNKPSNWVSLYSGDAWTRDDGRADYYLHQYSEYQPDLNLANPKVHDHITNALDEWFTRGVDGFNLHGVSYIYENEDRRDEPDNPDFITDPLDTQRQYDSLLHYYTAEFGDHHTLLRNWRKGLFDQFSTAGTYRIMLTDSMSNTSYVSTYYGTSKQPEADMPQNFNLVKLGDPLGRNAPTTGNEVKALIDEWMDNMPEKKWPNFVMGNHEVHRVASRLGPLYAAAANMLILTLPGTPICYYGDEIGMEDVTMTLATTKDLKALNDPYRWEEKTRDPERSPMQWVNDLNAGFSSNETGTWLPVNENYKTGINVADRQLEEWSILHMFTSLTYLRTTERAFENTAMHHVHSSEEVVSYIRETSDGTGRRYFVAINFGTFLSEEDYYDMDPTLPIQGTVVVATDVNRMNTREGRVELNKLPLAAGEGLVVELDPVEGGASFIYNVLKMFS
ncbi:alpha-glucosidase-like [Amphiura filiformis]|uniref:alpha-glucosidase-like n=1 Tax=Amphiura filiformis TaxID=82378 RepID=UPI003B217DCA